ncbi:MAG: hypothetical protein MUP20_00040, partial [Methyloceanibacter sp.]|nr:hypothetical protein [Methyloceanibacter sp.]
AASSAPVVTSTPSGQAANPRAHALAERLEQGARQLASLANSLSDAEWHTLKIVVHNSQGTYDLTVDDKPAATGLKLTNVPKGGAKVQL